MKAAQISQPKSAWPRKLPFINMHFEKSVLLLKQSFESYLQIKFLGEIDLNSG